MHCCDITITIHIEGCESDATITSNGNTLSPNANGFSTQFPTSLPTNPENPNINGLNPQVPTANPGHI